MNNSVINYLHRLAPELAPNELLVKGNLQFSFYIDNQLIYTENIHQGCSFGSGGNKNTSTTFRVPLTSTKGEDWWAMYMWDRFKANGGDNALSYGKYILKIELRPYIMIDNETKVGELIGEGEVTLIIKKTKITAKEIAVQSILPNSGWKISSLEIDKNIIEQLNTEIAAYRFKDITSIVVIYEGELLIEEYFNGAERETLHDTRSAGKSFTSTLMGLAINDGYLESENMTLKQFYNLEEYTNYVGKKDSVKIQDLLTMSSAFSGSDSDNNSPGNEENMYPTENWVKFTLDLPMDADKSNGGRWDYFTAGVVLLGDILNSSVPGGLEKYAEEKLFKPLGITNYQWQYTPQGVVNTAGSLQMRSLDYAKYAQLYKNNGKWNGNRLLSEAWVKKTFSHHISITGRENQFYDFLFWNKTLTYKGVAHEVYYCAGNGGNQFMIFNDIPLVVIVTSKAYNKPYGHFQTDRIVNEYILPAVLK
ncbi:serine hydrolase domain-containing protein [Flavobacterium alkalisoli]|uniref:serine hydrolase domain-containing protein n=1 Tax=Flavobacterium alkalisoli TaxID=2602769 RepID=UPI003A8DA9A4